jgi:hypothetical protein
MFTRHEPASGLFRYRNGPLFYSFFILFPAMLAAQTDSLHVFRVDAGTEYFDIFSQTSDRADSKIFTAAHYAGATYRSGSDSFSLFFRSARKYGALQQRNSLLSFTSTNLDRTIETHVNSSWHFVTYSLMLGYNIDAPPGRLLYGGGLAVAPWERSLTVSASFTKSAQHNGTGVLFRDFFVPFDNAIPVTQTAAGFSVQPVDDLYGEFCYDHTVSTNGSPRSGYGVRHSYRADHAKSRIRFHANDAWQMEIFADRSFTVVDATVKQENQSFGTVDESWWERRGIGATVHVTALPVPVSFRYSFNEMFISGSGEIESWPFTSLAASVIANRLYFIVTGSVKYHSAVLSAGFTLFRSAVTFELEYDLVLPDMTLEHWEPEFLVFGRKNFARDPFSISTAHLGKIHAAFSRTFSPVTVHLFVDQYFPIKIEYRKFESIQNVPPPAAVPSRKPITDGGRKMGFRFSVNL